jgi:hypothetical protein
MSEWLSHPDCTLYALVDGLQFERYFGCEITVEKNVTYPFFDTYPDSKIAFSGPWLFKLNCSENYRGKLNELEIKYPSVSWLLSPLTPERLLLRFKEFSTLELPDGKYAFFRFYDPRVLESLGVWLEFCDCIKLIQGVSRWVFTSNDKVFDLRVEVDCRQFD